MVEFSAQVWRVITVFLLTAGWFPSELAAESFRYVDDSGVTVLNDHVPPNLVKNGYTILDASGRVLEIIPRALTPEEIIARDKQLQLEEQERNRIAAREAADAALLRLYSSPNEVKRARDSKVASAERFVDSVRINIQHLLDQKRQLEVRVANIERAGGSIPKENLERITSLDARIEKFQAEISTKATELDQLKQRYAADLKRLLELHKLAAESS